MAVLIDSGLQGVTESLLVHGGSTTDITTAALNSVNVTYNGFDGDSHSGLTRESCVRVKQQYAPGTEIRNTRQISIVSVEELAQVAELMEIPSIEASWLGANICVSGIADFSLLPPSTRLLFSGGVSLVIDMENEPCEYPANVIEQHYTDKGRLFVKHAYGRRGVTAWVEKQGSIDTGDVVSVHVPRVRAYPHGKQHKVS